MTKKLIFFDIDGTLLNHDKQLPEKTIEAINQLKEQGHIVAIATGRGPFMYEDIRESLGVDTYVSYNGSFVVYEGDVIYTAPLDKQALLQLEVEGHENNHPMMFMDHKNMRQNVENHPSIDESIATLKLTFTPDYDPSYHAGRVLYQALFFVDQEEIKQYEGRYPEFEFVRWHPLSVDILPAGGSKWRGIKQLIDYVNIDPSDVYAFGDGLNDVEMLENIHNSVAMGNGCSEAKQVADYVTADVDEDGLYLGIKEMGLI